MVNFINFIGYSESLSNPDQWRITYLPALNCTSISRGLAESPVQRNGSITSPYHSKNQTHQIIEHLPWFILGCSNLSCIMMTKIQHRPRPNCTLPSQKGQPFAVIQCRFAKLTTWHETSISKTKDLSIFIIDCPKMYIFWHYNFKIFPKRKKNTLSNIGHTQTIINSFTMQRCQKEKGINWKIK